MFQLSISSNKIVELHTWLKLYLDTTQLTKDSSYS